MFDLLKLDVDEHIRRHDGYWPEAKIFERLVEEVGEIARARRDPSQATNDPRAINEEHEVVDAIFTLIAYANKRGFELNQEWKRTVTREL